MTPGKKASRRGPYRSGYASDSQSEGAGSGGKTWGSDIQELAVRLKALEASRA